MAIVLRLARETDAEAVLAVYAPYVRDTSISFEVEPPAPDDIRQRIRTVLAHAPWLVCESDGDVLGYAYAGRFHGRAAYRWTVEVTVYVDRDHHRRRIGEGLYSALLDGVRAQGFRTAVGTITLPNPASVGLHERFGFRPAGVLGSVGFKHGRWHDVGWWALALGEYTKSPPVPRPLNAIVDTAGWREALERGAVMVGAA